MAVGVWTVALLLTGLLLAYTTYAAGVGLLGVLTGRTYEWCQRCHEHYLADGSGQAHVCSLVAHSRPIHGHSLLRHRHVGSH
jgi:hypothetical protein